MSVEVALVRRVPRPRTLGGNASLSSRREGGMPVSTKTKARAWVGVGKEPRVKEKGV